VRLSPPSHAALPLLALLLCAAACTNESGLHKADESEEGGPPQILVAPELLDFGGLRRHEEGTRSFTVTNVGERDLHVREIVIEGEAGFLLPDPVEDLSFVLPSGGNRSVSVLFSPTGPDAHHDRALVSSDDPESPVVAVDLQATGLYPDLVIEPDPYDFGVMFVGCPALGRLRLVNQGEETLTVSSLELESAAYGLLSGPELPLILAPGESSPFDVSYVPLAAASDRAFVRAGSDDPLSPTEGELRGAGIHLGLYEDRFVIPEYPSVDLMFVVDQSGSMADDQASLAANFGLFVDALSDIDADWQIMVVNYYSGCNSLGILRPSTADYESIFAEAVRTGSYEEWHSGGGISPTGEAGLHVAWAGVDVSGAGECNAGFMRADTWLHIVIVTDEPDQSPNTWDWYVDAISALKGSRSKVRISAIAGDYPSGCASAAAGVGYYEAVTSTGGSFLSICSDWGTTMTLLADVTVSQDAFDLSETPDPSTLVVTVDGSARASGWRYDATSNAVIFEADVPSGGSEVSVSYLAVGACE
jgi:hypothetical protein